MEVKHLLQLLLIINLLLLLKQKRFLLVQFLIDIAEVLIVVELWADNKSHSGLVGSGALSLEAIRD